MKYPWLILTIVLCFGSLIVGFLGGVYIEKLGSHVDLCADETSVRYIHDAESRRAVCGQNTR